MSVTRIAAFVAIIALQGPALASPLTSSLQEAPAAKVSADVRVAQAKKASDAPARNAEALYSQCRAAVVRAYGRASGSRDPNQDSLNAEIRMQEAASLDSKIDYCVQNGGRP